MHTTNLYNTPIQNTDQKLSGKEKLAFIEVIKRRHIYPDRVRILFILAHKSNQSERKREHKNRLSLKQEKN